MNGLCECGCGNQAPIATGADRKYGAVKGQPRRYIAGHYGRTLWQDPMTNYAVDEETGCWIWGGRKNPLGYGEAKKRGTYSTTPAHRLIWQEHYGIDLPRHLHLDHLCRNPSCVNPDHLEVTTAATNRRRGAGIRLTESDAEQIRRSAEPDRVLAARFGVAEGTISWVRTGRSWLPNDTTEADRYNALAASRSREAAS